MYFCYKTTELWCGLFFFPAEHDIFGEVSSSDDEVDILDSVDDTAGPAGFRPEDVKDSLDLGFAEAAATLDPDVCEWCWECLQQLWESECVGLIIFLTCCDFHHDTVQAYWSNGWVSYLRIGFNQLKTFLFEQMAQGVC